MSYKIVSTGWNCAPWIVQTLQSVLNQSEPDWDVWIIYDPSDDNGAEVIQQWCAEHDERFHFTLNAERQFAVRNQYEAVRNLNPQDEDIVLWLDLDGDQLAHEHVLRHLGEYYASTAAPLVTYGSYKAVPDQGTSPPAVPFPREIVLANAYRHQMATGECCFNHLRTMKGKIVNALPESQFHYENGPQAGAWYQSAGDYVFMAGALERAGGRYMVIPEVLLLYNHDNPYADYLTNSIVSFATTTDFLARTPLTPLESP